MPRRQRHRTMKGGFLESLTQSANDVWEKTKKAANDAYGSATGSITSSSSYLPPPSTPYTPPAATTTSGYMGGRMSKRMRGRNKSRKMRGGYSDNIAITGLASSAAPISDIKSSQPLNIVGGRRTKRRYGGKYRNGKSYKRYTR
jgi:hypothetical protein